MVCYWVKSNNVESTAPYWPTAQGGAPGNQCDLMKSIQNLLRLIRYYGGTVDGIPGTVTAKAIQNSLRPGDVKGFGEEDGAYTGPADGLLGYNSAVALQRAAQKANYTGPVDGDPRANAWVCYRNWLQGLYNVGYRV